MTFYVQEEGAICARRRVTIKNDDTMNHPDDPALFAAVADAVGKAVEIARERERRGHYFRMHLALPKLIWRTDGLPFFVSGEELKDYGDVVSGKGATFQSDAAFRRLLKCLKANKRTAVFFMVDRFAFDLLEPLAIKLVARMADAYLHAHPALDFTVDSFLPIYLPIELALLSDELDVAFLVPILSLKFACRHYTVEDGMQVVRMSDPIQVSRARLGRFTENLNTGIATHALALSVYWMSNEDFRSQYHNIENLQTYPLQLIDVFFASVRIVTGFDTGYSQLLVRPIDWTSPYEYHPQLTPLDGTAVRAYPSSFEKQWPKDVPTVSCEILKKIAIFFGRLRQLIKSDRGQRLQTAVQRLNKCVLRIDDEGGIVDAAIGLEALLSDGNQEMTYKVGMRMAAIALLAGHQNPSVVVSDMKTVYSYRSAVVHGDAAQVQKRRTMQRAGKTVSTTQVALEYLRTALHVVVESPNYLNTKAVDEDVLLRAPSLAS